MLNMKILFTKVLSSITPNINVSARTGYFECLGLAIHWGYNSQSVSSASTSTWTTTFSNEFAYTPVVFAQVVDTTSPKTFTVTVTDITTTGCKFVRASTASTSYNCVINWVAIGQAS